MSDDRLFAPWGVVSPGFWGLPVQGAAAGDGSAAPLEPQEQLVPSGPPEAYRQRIETVTAAFGHAEDRARLVQAGVEAERLDQEIAAEFGEGHPHTVNIRELRGWIAHLLGDHGLAARWYVHTTGLQMQAFGAEHDFTQASAHRAYAMWKAVEDRSEILAVGSLLLPLLSAVEGESSKIARAVRKRLDRLVSEG